MNGVWTRAALVLVVSACWTSGSTGSDTIRPPVDTLPPGDTVPPPTAGPWPNLPAGYSTLAEHSFNSPIAGAWSLIWNTLGLGAITSDASAPYSPGGVMQFKYPAGFTAGESPGTIMIRLGGLRRAYVGIWWKASSGWQGHDSHVNKIQFLFPSEGNGDIYMAAFGPPGGPYELVTCLQFVNADTRAWLRANKSPGRVTMGEWHRIEWLVDYGTQGVPDGQIRWWMDGKLVGEYTDVLFPAITLDNYKLAPTWGGIGGAKTQTDYFWYDHVLIAKP